MISVKKLKTPYDDEPGFVSARMSIITGDFVILYNSREAGFAVDLGKWTMLCCAHSETAVETSRERAKKKLLSPESWCGTCSGMDRHAREQIIYMPIKTMEFIIKTPEDQEREMRFWANKAKNNAEKTALFETMYGVKPDVYWD